MKLTIATLISVGLAGAAQASLWVDFNSNQDGGGTPVPNDPADATNAVHNQTGYSSYHARHEVAADFSTATYNPTFAITGAATVNLTPAWPNTTDNRVQQMIDRGSQAGDPPTSFDGNWDNTNGDLNLVTDFIGIDTRTGNGGNGNWDGGTVGTPTYMTLTLNGLAAGSYTWTSFHADTEHVHGNFSVWIDTGAGFNQLADGSMTAATPAGSNPVPPAGLVADTLTAVNTYNTSFTADGASDVTIRYAPHANTGVHAQIWGVNGFQLEQVPEPSTGLLGLLGAAMLLRRRR